MLTETHYRAMAGNNPQKLSNAIDRLQLLREKMERLGNTAASEELRQQIVVMLNAYRTLA